MSRARDDAMTLATALGLPASASAALRARLEAVGGLRGLQAAGPEALDGVLGPRPARRLEAVLELGARLRSPPGLPPRIDDADAVAAFFRPRLEALPIETFWVLMLDARGRVLGHQRIGEGTLTSCLVHPREVFGPAIRARAAQVVLVHNHPSGDPTPSDEDRRLTDRLGEAGLILGIPVVDHVVVAARGHASIGPPELRLPDGLEG
jgi:DNA repair protein RadC